jgi:hypothetical protein
LAPSSAPKATQERAKRRRRDSRRSHGRAKLPVLDHLDKRTAAGQRAIALLRAFEADLGGADRLSEGARQLARRAAVLSVFIESIEVRLIEGKGVEVLDWLSATNCLRRIIEDLGAAARQARDVTPLRERLALETF